MPNFSSISIPVPKDWQAFERGMRILFQGILKDSNTQQNGRVGQPQHGVDVFGNRGGGGGPQVGVQCKGKDANFGEPVTATELEEEVRKSSDFKPDLKEFILVTTAQTDGKIQEVARQLEAKIRAEGRDLSIAVWGWQQIEAEIGLYPDAIRFFHPDATPFTDQILSGHGQIINDLGQILKELHRRTSEMDAASEQGQASIVAVAKPQIAADAYVAEDLLDKHLHEQIDTYRDLLRSDRPQTALQLLEKLKETAFTDASNKIKLRILANIGAAHHRLGHYDIAADYFLEAFNYGSDELPAIANKIAALLIKGREREAHEIAVSAVATHPESADIALQRLQARAVGETIEQVWPTLHERVRDDTSLITFRIFTLREEKSPEWRRLTSEALQAHPDNERLKIFKAESVLERILDFDHSMLGVAHGNAPTQAELVEAAETLEEIWEKSRKLETPPEISLAHNGALLWKLLQNGDKARHMLDTGFEAGLHADEAYKLRLSLYKRPDETSTALQLSERLADTPEARTIRAELYIDTDPAKSRELLADRGTFAERDAVPAALVVVESLVKQGRYEEALAEAERIKAALPAKPHGSLISYRVKLARADEDADADLDEAVAKVNDGTDFPSRFLVCEALEKARRFDDVVDLLDGRVSTAFDSIGLRMLIAAAANSDRRSKLRDLLASVSRDLRDVPFYRNSRIALAMHTGDITAAEREIRAYLSSRPRNLEMHLQLMHVLFRRNKTDVLKGEAAKPASDFDGSPSDFMKLAQFKEGFGDWREAYALAYATLLKNPHDPVVSMGYVGVFLRPGHSRELEVEPKKVAANMAVELRGEDQKPHAYVIEPDQALRPSPQYLSVSHKLAMSLIDKGLNDDVHLPDGTPAKVTSIKPKELHALHELLENFQNLFPESEGLERVRFNASSANGMQEVAQRLQQRHDAIEHVTDLYERGVLPLSLAARSIGADAVDLMLGLSATGHDIRICQGSQAERDAALAAIKVNGRNGCVIDLISLHTARRLGLLGAVQAVCGPIGIVDRTQRRYQRKIFELSGRMDEPDISLSWNDGKIVRTEATVEQKKEALALLQADADWIRDNAKIIPANGTRDPSPGLRDIMRRFGSGFVDDLRAAQGSGLILISEDFMFRGLATSEFGVSSTWLQPVLIRANADGVLSDADYLKAMAAMIEARFTFISVEAKLLISAVKGHQDIALSDDFKKLASRLGGKDAELSSHVNVALGALRETWKDEGLSWTMRQAMLGQLLHELLKWRTKDEQRSIISTFSWFGTAVLQDRNFCQYLVDWMRGHFLRL